MKSKVNALLYTTGSCLISFAKHKRNWFVCKGAQKTEEERKGKERANSKRSREMKRKESQSGMRFEYLC